jgi:tRNA pseudouridine55 synthase
MSKPRRKPRRAVSGWIVFDKPYGMGSTEAVSKLRWLFNAEKAGHAGTLDPLASGMLPVALGEATKTVPFVVEGAKTYRFAVAWGSETATDDREGEVTRTSQARPSREDILSVLSEFTGTILQQPPSFSAIKVDGARAYDLARDGEMVELAARPVRIDRLEIIEHSLDETVFEAECGKGTYVRSLARDIGRRIGCFGHVSSLRRTCVHPFTSATLVSLGQMEDAGAASGEAGFGALDAFLLPPEAALEGLPQIWLDGEQVRRVRLGNPVMVMAQGRAMVEDAVCAMAKSGLVAIGELAHGEFRPRRVFAEA